MKRDTRETGGEKRGVVVVVVVGVVVWKEKLEKSILSVLISRDCDGSGGHAAVIESC